MPGTVDYFRTGEMVLLLIVRINVVFPPGLLSQKFRKVFDSKEKAEKRSDA
jgi:hypothetical protein